MTVAKSTLEGGDEMEMDMRQFLADQQQQQKTSRSYTGHE